jgi:hypothetical protein
MLVAVFLVPTPYPETKGVRGAWKYPRREIP